MATSTTGSTLLLPLSHAVQLPVDQVSRWGDGTGGVEGVSSWTGHSIDPGKASSKK